MKANYTNSNFKILTIVFFIVIAFANYSKAQTYNLYGTISDSSNGELMIGCTVFLSDKSIGTISNSYGYYSIKLPKGNHKIVYSFVGYKADTLNIRITKNTNYDVRLTAVKSELSSVEIIGKSVVENEIGKNKLDAKQIKAIPAVLGEPDVMKSLQLLPGVQTTNEGTTNLSIRGGTHDQNLIILDEAPIYNPSHVLSLVSAFNPDAIKEVSIYKGYFPAQYGGRLSSVVELRMKEGNNKKFTASGGIGVVASRLTIETPIIKNKSSIMISGRYGYPGDVLNGLDRLKQLGIITLKGFPHDNVVWFYDVNFKINHKINSKNHIYLSSYSSKDEFELRPMNSRSHIKWANSTITARWNHIHNSKMFMNQTIFYSNYNYAFYLLDEMNSFNWTSGLTETNYKLDIDYYLNQKNHLKFGCKIGLHKFLPGEISKRGVNSGYNNFSLHSQKTLSSDIYISNDYKLNKKIKINYGIRYSSMTNLGSDNVFVYDKEMELVKDTLFYKKGQIIKYHNGLEPRFSADYNFKKNNSIKISYCRTKQYLHLISNSSVGMPTDVWLPANTYIEPSVADQYSIGYFNNFGKSKFSSSVELYYRDIRKIIDFVDNADLFVNNQIETQILPGKRKAYGAELFLRKTNGKINGWISYSLSKAEQQINGVNDNKWYPAYFDKLHNLSIFLNYKLHKSWEFNSVFKFTSGGNATVPKEIFYFHGIPFIAYTERNAYKLPDYHRLDVSLVYNSVKNKNRKWKSVWSFGAYNVYNRKNVFVIDARFDHAYQVSVNKVYLYGIVPYISYEFKI